MNTLKIALVAAAVAASGVASAVTSDGTLGSDSTGTADVVLIKQDAVQITGLNDIDLGTHATLAADQSDDDDVCVFNSTTSYNITFTSANAAFELQNGAGDTIPYTVGWSSNGGAAATVAYSTAITGNTGDATSLSCGGGTNANFSVTVTAADFNAANPGTYEDTITLFVEAI